MKIANIGIIGYGRFGKVLAKILSDDFELYIYDKFKKELDFDKIKFRDIYDVASCKVVFFCVPVSKLEEAIIEALPYIKEDSVILDICSTKIYSTEIMKKYLPKNVEIVPTHPMFGPDSISSGIKGLPYIVCPIDTKSNFFEFWVKYLENRGLKVFELSCEEHDRIMAYSICLTQLIGRAVNKLGITSSDFDTKNFQDLLMMREIACNDTAELFKDIQKFNPFAKEMREKFFRALEEIETSLKD